jgi:hypothetical protein
MKLTIQIPSSAWRITVCSRWSELKVVDASDPSAKLMMPTVYDSARFMRCSFRADVAYLPNSLHGGRLSGAHAPTRREMTQSLK